MNHLGLWRDHKAPLETMAYGLWDQRNEMVDVFGHDTIRHNTIRYVTIIWVTIRLTLTMRGQCGYSPPGGGRPAIPCSREGGGAAGEA